MIKIACCRYFVRTIAPGHNSVNKNDRPSMKDNISDIESESDCVCTLNAIYRYDQYCHQSFLSFSCHRPISFRSIQKLNNVSQKY